MWLSCEGEDGGARRHPRQVQELLLVVNGARDTGQEDTAPLGMVQMRRRSETVVFIYVFPLYLKGRETERE